MVSTGDDVPYQLFGTPSRFPGSAMFSEDREQYDHSSEFGQCDSSHLHQPDGGTHSKLLCQLALALCKWCIQSNLFLIVEHLPGQQNVLADHESRNLKD